MALLFLLPQWRVECLNSNLSLCCISVHLSKHPSVSARVHVLLTATLLSGVLKPLCVELFCDYSSFEIIVKAQGVVFRQNETIAVKSSTLCVIFNTIMSLFLGWKLIFGAIPRGCQRVKIWS